MLPPLQLLAQDKATLTADLPMGTGERRAQSRFETSLAAVLSQSAAPADSRLRPEKMSGTGRILPPGGKDLPLQEPKPDFAGGTPELLPSPPRPAPAGKLQVLPRSPENDTIESMTLPGSLPVPADVPQITPHDTMPFEHAVQIRPSREIAALPPTPQAAAERAPLAELPAVHAQPPPSIPERLPPSSSEQLPPPPAVAGEMPRQALPVDRTLPLTAHRKLPLPGADTGTEPVFVARVAAEAQPDEAEPRLVQQSALSVPPAVLRDQRSDLSGTPLQEAAMQAEFVDRKSTLAGTVPQPPTPASISHAAPTTLPTVSTPAVPQPLQLLNPIDMPPGANGWSDTLGDRVVMMVGSKIQSAEVRLNPAELGPLRVHISVDDGTATVNFHAQHPHTRDAIEQALPRLRDMLSDQGLSLGDTNVSEHGVPHEQANTDRHGNTSETIAADNAPMGIATDSESKPTKSLASAGMIDLFA